MSDKEFRIKTGLIVANTLIYAPEGQANVAINSNDVSQATFTVNGHLLVTDGMMGITIGNTSSFVTINATSLGRLGFTGSVGVTTDTTSTGRTPSLGNKLFQTTNPTYNGWVVGSWLLLASAANPTTNWMLGQIISYTPAIFNGLQMNIVQIGSAPLLAGDWQISLAGAPGGLGYTGSAGYTGSVGFVGSLGGTGGVGLTGPIGFTGSTPVGTMSLSTTNQSYSGGVIVVSENLGTGAGTVTINPGVGPLQFITNNGVFTLAAPTNDGACDILITNGASASTITFSGFTVGASVGDVLDFTNAHKFILSIRRINGISTYLIKALQ